MICRYKLNANGKVLTFGNECLRNWDEVSYAIKRSDYGGAMRSFSSSFQFVGAAYEFILGLYMSSYLDSVCTVSVYTVNEDQSFSLLYSARLDFGSMSFADGVLSVNTVDDSIASYLNVKKSTQYEYPVSDLKENLPLNYDRLEVRGYGEWCLTGTSATRDDASVYEISFLEEGDITLPMYIADSEIPISNSVEMYDVPKQTNVQYSSLDTFSAIFSVKKQMPSITSLDVSNYMYVRYTSNLQLHVETNGTGTCSLIMTHGTWLSGDFTIYRKELSDGLNDCSFDIEKYITGLFDRHVFLYVELKDGATCTVWQTEEESAAQRLRIEYKDRGAAENIDVIKPVTLLNSILASVNDGGKDITGEIETGVDPRLDNALVVAAESVRGLGNAKIYTSWKKFSDWMAVMFGFVPVITGNTVKFVHRDSLYSAADAVDVEGEVRDFEFKVDDGIIYSSVKAGYNKKDYDSANGRDEFRWTNEYDTGIDIKSNTLDLVSPYRADAYGIEFLTAKRGEETSDTESDTDVFFVSALLVDSAYVLDRSVPVTGVLSPETMFNVMYSPRSILEANSRYIGSTVRALIFASSEGNSDVSVDSIGETDNFYCGEGLFSAAVVTFTAASARDYGDDTLLRVVKNGRTITGYLNEKSIKYGKYDGAKYELLVKSIE